MTGLGAYVGAVVVGAVSSIVPVLSIEVFLVGLAVATSSFLVAPVVLLAAAGQLAGKLPIYYATRRLAEASERVQRLRAWLGRWARAPHLVLGTGAVLGLPPFSMVATAAGVLAVRPRAFFTLVFAGRALRFAILILAVRA